ncbi:hypothetical protein THRCLA_07491 [Thraustotheca clavata]|uniref:EF-hand domain-containing protein n=1 Tax=Thraustotheca clavata TaxID=74557 RepID=A0A1V9ZD18_9STRA|nr:hypothetical protein THRCLA_07491 [Thraustotheca clavata]
MDLMMRLKGQAFKAISEEFKAREECIGGAGLPLQDFVEIMLRALPKSKSAVEKEATISGLIDLFNDIDINGDGTLEFNEFTSYCVDAGMVATRVKTAPLKYQYIKNKNFVDRTTQGAEIEKLKWFPDLRRAIAVESKSSCVKIYTPDFLRVQEVYTTINPVAAMQTISSQPLPPMNDSEEVLEPRAATGNDLDVLILDAEFLTSLKLLAVTTSNFALTFYDIDHYEYMMENQTTIAQNLLRWCEPANLLFTSGNNKVLNVWIVKRGQATLIKQILDHQDLITDVIAIPQYDVVLSCDLKRHIYLWDIQDCRPRGILVGHTNGVRQMVFSPMNDLLLTAGFEFDAFGWDISSKQRVMTLSGHKASLVGVQLARFHTERAVTADITGLFKVWNIHRLNGSHAQLLESISPASTIAHFNPRSFITLVPKRDIVAASCVLHIFESIKIQKHDEIPLRAFFHHGSNQFLGLTETSVNLWDGSTGLLLEEFTGLTQSSFLLCCQDVLHRKLITATDDGTIEVYNCTNLARVRRSTGNIATKQMYSYLIGRIGSLHYDSKNKLILVTTLPSTTRERQIYENDFGSGGIYIFDDSTMGECTLVRSLTNLDVSTSAFSVNASLIATVAGDKSIRCWDFETLQLQIVCRTETADIHLVEFMDPFPVIVAADGIGNIFFFATSPQYTCNTGGCLHAIVNTVPIPQGRGLPPKEQPVIVTSMKCILNDDTNKYVLITGDEKGYVTIWDLSVMIHRLQLHAIPDDKLKSKRRGYNAHNTFSRVFGKERVDRVHHPSPTLPDDVLRRVAPKRDLEQRALEANIRTRPHHTGGTIRTGVYVAAQGHYWDIKDVAKMHSWIAHLDTINSIEWAFKGVISERPNILITSAFDASMYIWDWHGTQLGCLTANEDEMHTHSWRFVRENAKRARERQDVVAEIMTKLDMTSEEREHEASLRRQLDFPAERVNPLLQTQMFEKKPRKKSTTYEQVTNQKNQRRRQTADQIKASARHASLMQVGPLITVRKVVELPATEDEDEPEPLHRWSVSFKNLPTNNNNQAPPTLTERLIRLQHQEALKVKTDKVYVNMVHMQRDKLHRLSRVRQNLTKDVDITPSQFLAEKLALGTEKAKPPVLRRPTTAPVSTTAKLPPCKKINKKLVGSSSLAALDTQTNLPHRLLEMHNSSKSMMALLIREDGEAIGDNTITSPTIGKLRKINSIISNATKYNNDTESSDRAVDEATIKQHIAETQSKYDQLMRGGQDVDLSKKKKQERALQRKLEKEKRMQRYMAQKKRETHAKIGNALRHTSILFNAANGQNGVPDEARKQRRFGIYTTKEVMVIIRLFWMLDTDCSGSVTEDELDGCRNYFESMGYTDMATIFQTIDTDRSGEVSLAELLKICFPYASPTDIHDMLALEKLGRSPSLFADSKILTGEQLNELREIFNVFDADHSGTVSFDEVLEALQCKDDEDSKFFDIEELRNLYHAADGDGNKELSFEEFVQLLQDLYDEKAK